jgi:hypothetical protein
MAMLLLELVDGIEVPVQIIRGVFPRVTRVMNVLICP